MGVLLWTGQAQAIKQVTTCTPANFEPDDVAALIMGPTTVAAGGKRIYYTVVSGDTVATIIDGLLAAIEASEDPEWGEVTASDETTYLKLTGNTAGKPFTVTDGSSDVGTYAVTIAQVRAGSAAVNEIQEIRLAGTPSGGTFTLSIFSETTGALAFDISAAAMETALEALTAFGAADVGVTRSGSGTAASPYIWAVTFTGVYAGVNVPLFSGDGTLLTGVTGYITHNTTTQGGSGVNEKQTVTLSSITTAGTFSLSFSSFPSPTGSNYGFGPFSSSATAAEIEAEINSSLVTVGVPAYVQVTSTNSTGGPWLIEFFNYWGNFNLPIMTGAVVTGSFTITITETLAGSSTAVNEVQTYTVNLAPTGGTYTLTFQGQTTAGIAYNAADSAVLSALEALSNIAVGDATVTRAGSGTLAAPYVYTVTFLVTYAGVDVQQLTSTSSLTGCGVAASTSQAAAAAVNEQQSITLSPVPTGGTFTLTSHEAETTGAVAYNASASTLQTAIIALATPVAGDIVVTGPDGGPWILDFEQAYAATDIALWTGSGASLTGGGTQAVTVSTTTAATGPNFADNTANYSTGAVPVNTDTLIFQDSDIDLLYNLTALSGVTLTALYVYQSYTGHIGLARHNGEYFEYRTRYFAVGATNIFIGQGDGAGSGRVMLNTGSVQTTIYVENTGVAEDAELRAVIWKGTHASNAVTINRGSFIACPYDDEAATIVTLNIGFFDSQSSDADVLIGRLTTLTTVNMNGGALEVLCAIAGTVTATSGELWIEGTGTVAQLTLRGDSLTHYNTNGTLSGDTEVANDAVLDFSQDMRSKTVTNAINVTSRTADVLDPSKVTGSVVIDLVGMGHGKELNLGNHLRITRGAVA